MSTSLYCSLEDVQRVLSIDGVNLRLDDDPNIYGDLLDEASRMLDDYLLPIYSESVLAANRRASYYAAVFACVLLCERRGNTVPRGIQRKLERNQEWLERIMSGGAQLPGASKRRTSAPTLSQPRVALSPFPHTVIEPSRVAAGPLRDPVDYPQRKDRLDRPHDYTG